MLGLFKPSPPIDRDEFDWLLACYAWLLETLDKGDPAILARTGALGPAQFEGIDPALRGHALAQALFDRVMKMCRMEGWIGELVEGETRRATRLQPGFALKHDRQVPLGLFSVGGGKVKIAYDPALVASPERLIATLAHESAHYLLTGKGDPPGGPDLIEHATDCAAAYLGFGAFLANAALNFRGFTTFDEQGWEMQASGYLSESALITATALPVHLARSAPDAAELLLKPGLRGRFRKALKAVRHRLPDEISDLGAIDLKDWA